MSARSTFYNRLAFINRQLQSARARAFATMANIHTPIPALKLNDGNAIPMVSRLLTFHASTHIPSN